MTNFAKFHQIWSHCPLSVTATKVFICWSPRLSIRNINAEDFGNYSCRAENILGKARAYISISGTLFLFKKLGLRRPLFIYFRPFSNNSKFSQWINVKNDASNVRCWHSNSQSLDHQSPPVNLDQCDQIKVAQSPKNRPIWSHWPRSSQIKKLKKVYSDVSTCTKMWK